MSRNDICMAGVGGAERVSMFGKIVTDFVYTEGMAVALTGADEVGPGIAAGSAVFGIVDKVEVDSPTQIILSVHTTGFTECAIVGTAAPVIGEAAVCNNKGELIKAPAAPEGVIRGVITNVNAAAKTATIVL